MDTVNIGVIGCGGRFWHLFNDLLARYPWIRVAALCDPSEKSVETMIKDHAPEAKVYDDYRDLVKDESITWVFVASWNCFHREHAIAAMEAGKDVFCEKPLATSLEDCVAIRDAQERTGRIFFIGFTLRYSTVYLKVKEILAEKTIGDIVSMEFNETLEFNHGGFIHGDWRRFTKNAGTHLLEKCCHDVDLVQGIVGSLPVKVASFGGLNFFTPENAHHMERLGPSPKNGKRAYLATSFDDHPNPFSNDKDIIDNQVVILQFANGVRSTFHTNCCAGIPERRMYIVGTEGTIRCDHMTAIVEVQKYGWNTSKTVWDCHAEGGHGGADCILNDQVAESLKNNVQPESSGVVEGVKSAIACFAIDQAMDSEQVVDVNPMWKQAGIEVY